METFDIPVRCECGSVRGTLNAVSPSRVVRAVCYCDDCQAFAHHLGRADTVLDDYGGTSIVQVSPSRLTITEGDQHLACVRLTGRNLLRWYAACCGTPIGNTPGSYKLHFLGLIHVFLDLSELEAPVDKMLGPVRARAFKKFATGDASVIFAMPEGGLPFLIGGVRRILGALLTGAYRVTPFFDGSGKPVAAPQRLSGEEKSRLPPYANA
ncbi:MAG: DUF6151 family protein [Gammaproteobacteria bacterium]|nr:DUF6151 family protein [Gammaproteobacteria bacterium]